MSRANPRTTHDNAGIAAWRFNLSHEIDSYETAQRAEHEIYAGLSPAEIDKIKLLSDRNGFKYGYRIGANMWVTDRDDYMAIILYDTEIIRYYPDGTFSVDNGGFNTPTTKERLQAFVPTGFIPFHHKKRLHLRVPGGSWDDAIGPLDHDTRITTAGEVVSDKETTA